MNRDSDSASDLRNLSDFKRVLLKLAVLYHDEARRNPRLQDHNARKVAELDLTIAKINERVGRLRGPATPGGSDG